MSTEEEAISRENCECTQLNINESSRDTYSSQNQEEEPEEIESNVWGLLRRKGGNREEYKLVYRIHDGQQDRYSIGRSRAADVLFEHRRASSIHCLIYCDYSEARLRVFIEDCSSNGTFVNNSLTRLRKGERIELKSGDEIYLVNPRYMKPEDEIAAFVFINMRERLVSQRKIVVAPDSQQVFCGNFHAEHIENYYIIGDQIGSGVCGQVHFCVHRETQQQCAVKIIDTRKFVMTGGLSIDDLKEEAEMMQQLDHPNIIKVLDTYQSAYAVFIVMELLRGGDLFDRIVERGKYTEDTARKLMVNLLSAVEYLHSKNIIHRDLKPENILLVDSYNDVDVKLTDFGLAKKANQEGLKTFCGTPQYFAPEVLSRKTSENGIGRYGAAADVWSLGVVLYILLSGTFPFAEEHLFDQISRAHYSFCGNEWTGISVEGKQLVKSMLTLRADRRITVQQALRHPWITRDTTKTQSQPSTQIDNKKVDADTVVEGYRTAAEMAKDQIALIGDTLNKDLAQRVVEPGTPTVGSIKVHEVSGAKNALSFSVKRRYTMNEPKDIAVESVDFPSKTAPHVNSITPSSVLKNVGSDIQLDDKLPGEEDAAAALGFHNSCKGGKRSKRSPNSNDSSSELPPKRKKKQQKKFEAHCLSDDEIEEWSDNENVIENSVNQQCPSSVGSAEVQSVVDDIPGANNLVEDIATKDLDDEPGQEEIKESSRNVKTNTNVRVEKSQAKPTRNNAKNKAKPTPAAIGPKQSRLDVIWGKKLEDKVEETNLNILKESNKIVHKSRSSSKLKLRQPVETIADLFKVPKR